MSFSGVKTAFLNIVNKGTAGDPTFAQRELPHLCASLQQQIVSVTVDPAGPKSLRCVHVFKSGEL